MKGKRILSFLLVIGSLLLLSACAHTHTFNNEWTYDEEYHWHSASCEHDTEVSDKVKHTFNDGEVVTDATCEAEGTIKFSCTECGYNYTNKVDALGHEYGEVEYVWDGVVSCTATLTCIHSGCDEAISETATISNEVTKEPTAEADGERTYTATFTNSSFETQTKVVAELYNHEHTMNSVVTEPTCTERGYTTYSCSGCTYSYIDNYVDATGHSEEKIEGHAATCTDAGLTDGKKCSVCQATLVAQNVIPATGHSEEKVEGHAATCIDAGLTDGKKCSVCQATLVAQNVIPATGHSEEKVEGHAATCTDPGLTDGKKCSVCQVTLVAQNVIPATGHSEEKVDGHAATCTDAGLTDGKKCSVCQATLVAQNVIPATGHTEVDDAAKEATCTDPGLTAGKHCSVCNTVLQKQETVEPKGHSYNTYIYNEDATCTEDGTKTATCDNNCGIPSTITAENTKLEHKIVNHEAKAATCTEDGWDAYETCDRCDYSTKVVIPAAHSWSTEVITEKAKCGSNGYQYKDCTVCDEIQKVANSETMILFLVPNSNWLLENARFAVYHWNASGDGWTDMTKVGPELYVAELKLSDCTQGLIFCRMDSSSTTNSWDYKLNQTSDLTIPTNGNNCYTVKAGTFDKGAGTWSKTTHQYSSIVTAPTCTEAGYTTHTCSACGDSYKDSTVDASGHDYEITYSINDTFTEVTAIGVCLNDASHTIAAETVTVTSVDKAATNDEGKSVTRYYVTFTNEYFTATYYDISNCEHEEVVDTGYAATCTTDGLTDGKHCSICGEVTEEQNVIPAFGHTPGDAATCTEAQICTVCQAVVVEAKGHKHVHAVEGKNIVNKCSCGDVESTIASNVVLLKPNSNWKQDNARFAVYLFNNSTNKNEWKSMTYDSALGVYYVSIPSGYPNIIFCRMNPSASANNWDNRWNQTANLTVPSGDSICYTIKAGSWDAGSW